MSVVSIVTQRLASIAFDAVSSWDSCALLARANRQLAQDIDASGDKCALFRVICAGFAALQDKCAQIYRFECLSLHGYAA